MNSVKDFLLQVKLYDTHINNKLEDLANMESLATKITTTLRDDAGISGGGNHDKIGNAASKIVDLQRELRADIDYYAEKKRAVCQVIDRVQHPEQLDILQKCYVLHKPLEQIAREKCMSYRNVCYLHGRALQAVANILGGVND